MDREPSFDIKDCISPFLARSMTKSVNRVGTCLRITERKYEHTQPPLILEGIEQSNDPRVPSKSHKGILLGECDKHFFFLDKVCLLQNFDGILLASANVGSEFYLPCCMGL